MPRGLQGILDGLAGLSDNELQLADTAEQVYVSGLALLKMLKHGRAGVPMEVMGLMLGEFVNDYAIRVVDVFSMPQSGNSVSVEAVDPAYQAEMLEMLRRVGRPEMVVGWYHSHPGFGCWFSGTDVNTQQSFEQLNSRAVGVVVDPIQSVKGKVVIDCFRLINPHLLMTGQEPRQTTSNLAHLNPPTITALVHGLNRHYYSLNTNFRKSDAEQHMLTNLGRPKWCDKLQLGDFKLQAQDDEAFMAGLKDLTAKYKTNVGEELTASAEQLLIKRVGKIDPVKRLALETESHIRSSLLKNLSALASMLGSQPLDWTRLDARNLHKLKVPELKALCGQLGLRGTGRKAELIERIAQRVETDSGPPPARAVLHRPPLEPPPIKRQRVDICICKNDGSTNYSLEVCSFCSRSYHRECLGLTPETEFRCPQCQLRNLDPFLPTEELVAVWWATTATGEARGAFSLQLDGITQFRRLNKEVVVRGIGLTNQNPYHCEWPRSLRIQVNDFLECIEPPDVDRKRRDVPIPITQYLRPGLNKLQFIATGVAQESVLVGVCLCNCETSESLARKIPEVPPEDTLQILQENLEGSDTEDCGVVNNDRENLRLNCSITLNRIQTPVRGYKCRHMQCFDLDSYLTVTAQSRAFNQRWKCPECHLVVRPADLRVDCLFRDILEKAPENAVEVLVLADGSWSVSQELQDRDETDLTDPDSEPAVMTIDSDSDCASPEQLLRLNEEMATVPIGVIRSPFTQKWGTPRQGGLTNVSCQFVSRANFDERCRLKRSIENSGHVVVVFLFHLNKTHPHSPVPHGSLRAKIRPPKAHGVTYGALATRSPHRPNATGLSVGRLTGVEMTDDELILNLEGLDIIDGTPVLTLEPYQPFYHISDCSSPDWVTSQQTTVEWRTSPPHEAARQLIQQILEQDPRSLHSLQKHHEGLFGIPLTIDDEGFEVVYRHHRLEKISVEAVWRADERPTSFRVNTSEWLTAVEVALAERR